MATKRETTLRELIELLGELRREVREGFAELRQRLDTLEKPRVAKVIFDPSRPVETNGGQR
jgi:hypothetical protein